MKKSFVDYIRLREETMPVTSKIKLQKGSKEFSPFTVNKETRQNLRELIKAFADSPNVGAGYTTIDKSKGEIEPQLKKKSLYLTGGAVRDHLKGKTPKGYDLVTDATPSEIRMILNQPEAGFTETKPEKKQDDKKYADLPPAGSKSKIFYASRWDKQGKELEFTVEVKGEKFYLATFSKSPKSRLIDPDKGESASSVEEDAANRDLTINSLYIPLTNADGDNSDLIDPHGGAHHLKNGEIKFVGDEFEKRMAEDPSVAFKYIKFLNRFGDSSKIPEKHVITIMKHKDLNGIPKDHIRKEFLSGLEHNDSNPRKYLKILSHTGLLNSLFPNAEFDPNDVPHNLTGDRWMAPAWILKKHHPQDVVQMLVNAGWSPSEAANIAHLVVLHQWAKNNFDPNYAHDVKSMHSGLTNDKIRNWMKMNNAHGPEIETLMNHDDKDLGYYVHDENGKRENPLYKQHFGMMPTGNHFHHLKRILFNKAYQDNLHGH